MNTALTILILLNALVRETPVVLDDELSLRAQARAEQLCEDGQWSHSGMAKSFEGYPSGYIGENLAKNWHSPTLAFNAWVHSESHYTTMKDEHFKMIGVGEAKECDLIVLLLKQQHEQIHY